MASADIQCLVPSGDTCGEGAYWDQTGALWWTDVCRFLLHRFDVQQQSTRSWQFGEPVVGVVPLDNSTELLVALGSRVIRWSAERGEIEVVHREPRWPGVRLNEVRAAPDGALWIGSMGNNVGTDGESISFADNAGELVRRSSDGQVTVLRSGLGISNTLAWDPDRSVAYTADTLRNEIYRVVLERGTGRPAGFEIMHESFGRGKPDGSAIDEDGCLWTCRFGGSCITRLTPDGAVDRVIELPTRNPTTCTFGGDDLSTLFVTSASMLTDDRDRLAGSVWAVDAGVRGRAAHPARLTAPTPG